MRTATLSVTALAFLAPLAYLTACSDDPEDDSCAAWCEMAITVELDNLEELGCEFTDDVDDFEAGCIDECYEIVSGLPDPGDMRACVHCVRGEVGKSPTWDELQYALNGPCEKKCFEPSMTEFWDDFWDAWGYEDYDHECE